MIIALDEVIPYWQQAFSGMGELRPYRARTLRPADIRDADALVVRSITTVDSALLNGSSVRFVGTVSVGMDHLDLDCLASRGIRVANAAGSNARSVAEYVTATLLVLNRRKKCDLQRNSLAVIGVGNVGSRVAAMAKAMGLKVLLCDPPLRDTTGDPRYRDLQDVLEADILTFHVPLTTAGPYPTRHMVDRGLLQRLSAHQFLLNSSRGPVFDCIALKDALKSGRIAGACLDVWEKEPHADYELLELLEIGTAHVAGYSLDGKIRATRMILEQLADFGGGEARWEGSHLLPPEKTITVDPAARPDGILFSAVLSAYNILEDDARLRALSRLDPETAAAGFDRLRNEYNFRPEFAHYRIEPLSVDRDTLKILRELGFSAAEAGQSGTPA
jgi:erythronate-4-phosphate dehydrogenase